MELVEGANGKQTVDKVKGAGTKERPNNQKLPSAIKKIRGMCVFVGERKKERKKERKARGKGKGKKENLVLGHALAFEALDDANTQLILTTGEEVHT